MTRVRLALIAVALVAAALVAACERPAARPADGETLRVPSRDGVSIAYETRGAGGLAVVFVHGWSCDRTYWAAQLEPFARDYRVVAVDLGGHGESGFGREHWTIESFGDDVAAVVDTLGLQRVVLVGHSMGGDVIAEAARRLGPRVKGLVLVDAYKQLGVVRTAEQRALSLKPFHEDFTGTTASFARAMFVPTSDSALVERVVAGMSGAPANVAISARESRMLYNEEMPIALAELKLPVIAINPDNFPTDTASLKRHGVEVVMMTGVGHFLMMEDPARFNGLLRRAVARLAR